MKLTTPLLGTALAAGLALSMTVDAAPFGIYDPRALAMGGVGVTLATARNANFYNPAMLAATRKDDDFAFGLPIVSARASDQDMMYREIDHLKKTGNALSAALDAFEATVDTFKATLDPSDAALSFAAATRAATALAEFSVDVDKVSNKSLDGETFVGGIVTIPSKKIGIGLHVSNHARFGAKFIYAPPDQVVVNDLASNLYQCITDPDLDPCGDLVKLVIDNQGRVEVLEAKAQSSLQVRGIAITEVGLAFAHRFVEVHNTDIGVTFKAQKVRTFDYVATVLNPDIDTDAGQKEESSANLDLGFAKVFGETYKAGLVVKNVIRQQYTTVLGNTITVQPQMRLGLSQHRGWANVGVDLDLTRNRPIAAGLDKTTQFVAIGAELDLIQTLQLRVGFRHDLAGNYRGVPSIGLGLSPFGVHIDLSVAGNEKELAAAFQLGFNF